MKNSFTIICALVISFTASCEKSDDRAITSSGSSSIQGTEIGRVAQPVEDVSAQLESAIESFKNRDIQAALTELDIALVNDPSNPQVLNLMGSCYVEMRDFEKALEAFTEASNAAPHNPSILFNIGEVHFVTKQWNEAITAFEETKSLMKPEQTPVRDLIEFKILLCHAGLENREEFARLAATIPDADDSLRSYFTKAAVAYYSNNKNQAIRHLTDAERAFPNRRERAPWEDTMAEFGYRP